MLEFLIYEEEKNQKLSILNGFMKKTKWTVSSFQTFKCNNKGKKVLVSVPALTRGQSIDGYKVSLHYPSACL